MTDWTCPDCGYSTDDADEIAEHDCESEAVALALGSMHCAVCECWGTVPGSIRCQKCTDEQEDYTPLGSEPVSGPGTEGDG